jgi:hypothetical protein
LRFDYDDLASNPGSGQNIFVCHTIDICAEIRPDLIDQQDETIPYMERRINFKNSVPDSWIYDIFHRINEIDQYNDEHKLAMNHWYIQTRNTFRLNLLLESTFSSMFTFPGYIHIGTTLESNFIYPEMTKAPNPENRALFLGKIDQRVQKYVTIEPILKFHLNELIELIKISRATTVIIGADSKKTPGLQELEPTKEETKKLITVLSDLGYKMILKSNLDRIIK